MKNSISFKFLAGLLSLFFLTSIFPPSLKAQKSQKWDLWGGIEPVGVVEKETKAINVSHLRAAVRAGRPQFVDTRAKIIDFLLAVKKGNMTPEAFYKEVSKLDMPKGKEVRHTLMEVKKDVGNYLGKNGLNAVFGEIFKSGATKVEADILTHRKAVVMETIKKAIVVYRDKVKAETGEYPKMSFYYGEVGGWPKEKYKELKFAGDIDFNFLSGDLDQAMKLKKIFDQMIIDRYGRTPEELDIPCTVHGLATGEVYVGKHGQSFAEAVTKVAWEIDFENANENMDLKAKKVSFKEVLTQMVMEARINKIMNSVDDLQSSKWPTQPGISLEMIRHFEHDIAGQNVFTDLESFVKSAKYTDRSFSFLIKELGDDAVVDQRLAEFTKQLVEQKKNPKNQVDLIKKYFEEIGKTIPFEVNLEINADGKGRPTIEANEKFIKEFWDICRKSMWEGANQVLKKKTGDLKRRIDALGEDDIEESKAIYEELVKMDEMIEIEDRILNDKVAGVHDLDPEYIKNVNDFRVMRKTYKEKSAKFGHVKYLDPILGKTFKWIETMLKNPKEVNIKLAGAALMSAPGKLNDALDYFDDNLVNGLRNGEGEKYIEILRKGQGLYWDEQVNMFLKGTWWEGKFDNEYRSMESAYNQQAKKITQWLNKNLEGTLASRGLKLVQGAGGTALSGIQTINTTFNESVSNSAVGGHMMTGMMLYSLADELPIYYDLIDKNDYEGLAAEFFKRRIPLGGAVERSVMGDYYGAGWELVSTIIPPAGIFAAAKGVGESIALGGIDAYYGEELELVIDKMYDGAEFKIRGFEKVGEDLKINDWELLSVTYGGEKHDYSDLIAKETKDAREMGECLQKPSAQRPACFPVDALNDGLFDWRTRDAFEEAFKKADAWIQLIKEMEENSLVGPKLKDHFAYKKYTRYEQIKVAFLKETKIKLEERKAGEEAIISGQFTKMYEELLKITEDLDIQVQLQEQIREEFGGEVYQFMTWLKDYMRGMIRSYRGDVDVWDVYEDLSAFVTKSLGAYKKVQDSRGKAEDLLGAMSEDQGLRVLTGPYFLEGKPDEDVSSGQKWARYPQKAKDKMMGKMRAIKKEAEVDPSELDLSEESYDAGVLKQLTFHESFTEFWIQANKLMGYIRIPSYLGSSGATQNKPNLEGGLEDQDRAMKRFAFHQKRGEEILEEYKKYYENQKKEEGSEGEDEGAGEGKGDGEAEDSKDLMEGLLSRMNALRAEVNAKRADIKAKAQAYREEVDAYGKKASEMVEKITTQMPAKWTPSSEDPQKMLGEIKGHSEKLAQYRDEIETLTLSVCQEYEKIANASGVKEVDIILQKANQKFQQVKSMYNNAQYTMKSMDAIKAKISGLGDDADKQALVDQLIAEGEAILSEGKTLHQKGVVLYNENSGLSGYSARVSAVSSEADVLMKTLEDEKEALSKKAKKTYKSIKSTGNKINKSLSSLEEESNQIGMYGFSVTSSLGNLKTAVDYLNTREGASASASQAAIKVDILSMYDAGMLFAAPIEEAYKNAQTCLAGVGDRQAQVATPQAREAAADCSSYPGTSPKWIESEQIVRCNCQEGYVWASTKGMCINKKQNEVANKDCSPYANTKPVWSDAMQRPVCDCVGNYKWNKSNTACVQPRAEQMAQASCSRYGQADKYWDDATSIVRCRCKPGYKFNASGTMCVRVPPINRDGYNDNRRRSDRYGGNSNGRRNTRDNGFDAGQFIEAIQGIANTLDQGRNRSQSGNGNSGGRTTQTNNCANNYSMGNSGGLYGRMTFKCNCPGWGFDASRSQCVQGRSNGEATDNRRPAGYTGGGSTGRGTTNTGRGGYTGGGGMSGGSSGGSAGGGSYSGGALQCSQPGDLSRCGWQVIGGQSLFGLSEGASSVVCICGCSTASDESKCAQQPKPRL